MKVEVVILLTIVVVVAARWVSRRASSQPTTVTVDRGVTIVRLNRDPSDSLEHLKATRELLNGLIEDGDGNILVDLGGIEGRISSDGMGAIVAAFSAHRRRGEGVFAVACPPGLNRRVWEICGFEPLVPTRDSVDEAMELFGTGTE